MTVKKTQVRSFFNQRYFEQKKLLFKKIFQKLKSFEENNNVPSEVSERSVLGVHNRERR